MGTQATGNSIKGISVSRVSQGEVYIIKYCLLLEQSTPLPSPPLYKLMGFQQLSHSIQNPKVREIMENLGAKESQARVGQKRDIGLMTGALRCLIAASVATGPIKRPAAVGTCVMTQTK